MRTRNSRSKRRFSLALVMVLTTGSPAAADDPPPIQITLHPQDEAQPAFRFRLLPSYMERTPGNAVVYFGAVRAGEDALFAGDQIANTYGKWAEAPLETLRQDADAQPITGHVREALRRAAYSDHCDWQQPIRSGAPLYDLALPEFRQTSDFFTILAASARVQIARGEFDQAIETLTIGYANALHFADSPLIIGVLFGDVWCDAMNQQVQQFIQQPGAPNLYWALSMLPSPFLDPHNGVDVEVAGLERTIPEFADLDAMQLSPPEWEAFYLQAIQRLRARLAIRIPDDLPAMCRQHDAETRRRLKAYGLPAERVDQMSVFEAVSHRTILDYRRVHQNVLKYASLPYPQAIPGIRQAIEQANQDGAELISIASLTAPAAGVKRVLAYRDREITVLRLLEALRIHAARNDGALPRTLADVSAVPIPEDPVTGQPFDYRLEQGRAVLLLPSIGAELPTSYEIAMAAVPGSDPAD